MTTILDFQIHSATPENYQLEVFERGQSQPQVYTNQTKLLRQDDKTPAAVWSEMEAFELLLEAEGFEEAAGLLLNAHTLLIRWDLGGMRKANSDIISLPIT